MILEVLSGDRHAAINRFRSQVSKKKKTLTNRKKKNQDSFFITNSLKLVVESQNEENALLECV